MSVAYAFSKEDMAIDQSLGYPRSYAKLCKDINLSPYCLGPPFTFTPYNLHSQEASRAEELDDLFPVIDPQAKATAKTRVYVSILWKQLNHLGNAGFDPAMFRVDPYGNVLYLHADSASPLAWDIDHWFPCSRGGLTVPSNLRILQWQVCKRKHNQLEFLVPWWDLQLGIPINQFITIFAASNSDFRNRAFRLLFESGEGEELNDLQNVDSHNFPQPFVESKEQLGLAPAAVVRTQKELSDASSSTLRSLDVNRQQKPTIPMIAASKKLKNGGLKENRRPDMVTNPYQALVMARDSLKHREETNKMKAEIHKLDDEVNELKLKNEEEKLTIQELELALIKRRRRAEKCRKLAEAQSSYRSMLEKMIRNAMHQNVVYKEQVRLNQAATNTLMARLEAQMVICSSAEKQLATKFKLRDELEQQIRPEWEQARKRSRTDDDDAVAKENEERRLIYLPRIIAKTPMHKQLRKFLEEEHKLSEEALSLIEEEKGEEQIEELPILTFGTEIEEQTSHNIEEFDIKFPFVRAEVEEDEESRKERGKGNVEKWLQMLLGDFEGDNAESSLPKVAKEPETRSNNDEIIKKLNEKYTQKENKTLMGDIKGDNSGSSLSKVAEETETRSNNNDEIIKKLNEKYPQKDIKILKLPLSSDGKTKNKDIEPAKLRSMSAPRRSTSHEIVNCEEKNTETIANGTKNPRSMSTPRRSTSSEAPNHENNVEIVNDAKKPRSISTPRRSVSSETEITGKGSEARKSFGEGKDKGIGRTESARFLRSIPSSPSMILNMKKGVDCIRKKPLVLDDEEEEDVYFKDRDHQVGNNFLKSSIKSLKKAVKI